MKEFEELFKQIYVKSYQKDYLLFHKKRFSYLYSVVNKLRVKKILDIGKSGFTDILKSAGYDVLALNKQDCDLEKDKIPHKGNVFDLVIYTEVIEHLRCNYLGSLKEIYRILKPGGFLLFGTPNSRSLRKLLFGPSQIDFTSHYKEFSMNECINLIKEAKFKIIYNKFNPYLDLTKKAPKIFLYYLILKIIPSFRESTEILAAKK